PRPEFPGIAKGEKGKARDIIAAIKTLHLVEREKRRATPEEKQVLARFGGFGAVALSLFPNPVIRRRHESNPAPDQTAKQDTLSSAPTEQARDLATPPPMSYLERMA